MKLVFDARVFEMPFSGIAKATMNLYKACNLYYSGEVDFIGLYKRKIYSELPGFIKTKRLSFLSKSYNSKNINNSLTKTKSSVMHFPWNGDLPAGEINAKKIITIHDLLPLEIPNYFSNDYEQQCYINARKYDVEHADIIFTDSDYSKKRIIDVLHPKIEPKVLYFGTTVDSTLVKKDKDCNKKKYFIYVGGYHPRKGINYILRSILELNNQNKLNFIVKIVGQKSLINIETEQLLKKCNELGLIEETGYLSENELVNEYHNAIGLLYLSKYEGFGLPPLEAMSVGCPVITTKYTSIPEICGNAALYVEPDNISDVNEKILTLLNNNNKRNELIETGYKQAQMFSWENSAKQFIEEIKK